jgi:hypothetical protein
MKSNLFVLMLTSLLLCSAAAADTAYQPFVLASVGEISLAEQTAATIATLEGAGFTVAGSYAPLPDTRVIVVTSPELQAMAAQTARGGYGAGQRIGITVRNGQTEVAFVNPLYIQFAYRMEADLQGLFDRLSETLGNIESFGAEKTMTAKKLGKYHYMIGMQRFDDPYELGQFDSHESALAAVEEGLAREGDALTRIYRIDIPGKQQAVFGVGMKAVGRSKDELDIDEAHQLSIVDFEGYSKVAYVPYEILVNGTEVEALHMRFRMAVHFPDLSMMGEHGFTKLMASPGATKDAFKALVTAAEP